MNGLSMITILDWKLMNQLLGERYENAQQKLHINTYKILLAFSQINYQKHSIPYLFIYF